MALITMTEMQGSLYRSYLDAYRTRYNRVTDAQARTTAFFCARSNDPWNRPHWC